MEILKQSIRKSTAMSLTLKADMMRSMTGSRNMKLTTRRNLSTKMKNTKTAMTTRMKNTMPENMKRMITTQLP